MDAPLNLVCSSASSDQLLLKEKNKFNQDIEKFSHLREDPKRCIFKKQASKKKAVADNVHQESALMTNFTEISSTQQSEYAPRPRHLANGTRNCSSFRFPPSSENSFVRHLQSNNDEKDHESDSKKNSSTTETNFSNQFKRNHPKVTNSVYDESVDKKLSEVPLHTHRMREYNCQICQKSFEQLSMLKRHFKVHHQYSAACVRRYQNLTRLGMLSKYIIKSYVYFYLFFIFIHN